MEKKQKPPSRKGPAELFTGDVWLDPIASGEEGSSLSVTAVHFTPGARSAWHTHHGGQTLYVTEGEGWVQARDEEVMTLRPGDSVFTPTGQWHWHGATAHHTMTHLSITDGPVEWGDHVTDDEYLA